MRAAPAPPVPGSRAALHARGKELLGLLTAAGDDLGVAIARRDTDLFASAMARLDDAERAARLVFAAAFALIDGPERDG